MARRLGKVTVPGDRIWYDDVVWAGEQVIEGDGHIVTPPVFLKSPVTAHYAMTMGEGSPDNRCVMIFDLFRSDGTRVLGTDPEAVSVTSSWSDSADGFYSYMYPNTRENVIHFPKDLHLRRIVVKEWGRNAGYPTIHSIQMRGRTSFVT